MTTPPVPLIYNPATGGWQNGSAAVAALLPTIAALRTSTGTTPFITVESYANPGDCGGGPFAYVAADTTSPDDGAEIIVNASGSRYYRQWTGEFDFRWAGAVGDGTGSYPTNVFTGTANSGAWNSI